MFGIFDKKDSEVERVVERLSKKLENFDEWNVNGIGVIHKSYNLKVSKYWISEPESVQIPRRWRKIVKKQIMIIHREHEKEMLGFVYDVLDDKYPYQSYPNYVRDIERDWLLENAKEDQYVVRGNYVYFSDETLAMAFKLQFS